MVKNSQVMNLKFETMVILDPTVSKKFVEGYTHTIVLLRSLAKYYKKNIELHRAIIKIFMPVHSVRRGMTPPP